MTLGSESVCLGIDSTSLLVALLRALHPGWRPSEAHQLIDSAKEMDRLIVRCSADSIAEYPWWQPELQKCAVALWAGQLAQVQPLMLVFLIICATAWRFHEHVLLPLEKAGAIAIETLADSEERQQPECTSCCEEHCFARCCSGGDNAVGGTPKPNHGDW